MLLNGRCERPSPLAPLLFTYQTLLLSVNVTLATVAAGPVLPAPVLLDPVYVQVALVALTLGVRIKRPAASTLVSAPPTEQVAPVTVTWPAGVAPVNSPLTEDTAGVDGAPAAPVMKNCVLPTPVYASVARLGNAETVTALVPVQPPASVAVTTTLKVPVTVGVPDTVPVPLPMLSPAGRPVAAQPIVPLPPAWV